MSSTRHNSVQKYEPIPTINSGSNMETTGLARNGSRRAVGNSGPADELDSHSVEAGGLPSTYSSQQLMPRTDSDSFADSERRGSNGRTRAVNFIMAVTNSHWFAIVIMCFVNLINYMDRLTIAGVLSDIQAEFGIGDDVAGLLQLAFVFSYMLCAPLFGYLGDRHSRRWIMVIGVVLWSMTTLLGSFMKSFGWFMAFRAMVGIGEASYSTIAPTIISDLFVGDMRSKMLAVFYFAIPVGSGLGYIVGSETAHIAGDWRWALRVTPFLGIAAALLLILVKEPERGESEGSHNLAATTYTEDLKDLLKNRSYTLSTAGLTCVAFVTGALSFFGPKFVFLGLRMQPGNENMVQNDVSYKFGIVAMIAGFIGVPLGSALAQRLRPTIANCDPYICAVGLLVSSPMVYLALVMPQRNATICFLFMFGAQVTLNVCWALVADILLYVVVPTRRSTAEAFQILISHAFGDASSPYIVGLLSEGIKKQLRDKEAAANALVNKGLTSLSLTLEDVATNVTTMFNATADALTLDENHLKPLQMDIDDSNQTKFEAMQYALFSTTFIEVLGAVFFLLTAAFILKDKEKAIQAVRAAEHNAVPTRAPVNID